MKHHLLFVIFVASWVAVSANEIQDAYWKRVSSLDLPVLHITTEDGKLPSFDVIYSPDGCTNCAGIGITNAEKLKGDLVITVHNDTVYNSGPYVKKESGMTIKVRGNTSASGEYQKKPYKIKLQKKADLLFRGDSYKDTEWVLLLADNAATMVGNMLNAQMQMMWAPQMNYVFLYINNEFRGLYILCEAVSRSDSRIDVSKEGYILEYDAYWWNEDLYIPTEKLKFHYSFKYPDSEDILPWQIDYLTSYIASVENAYFTADEIEHYIDVSSYARWLWIHDIVGDCDFAGSNMYFAKKDTAAASLLTMPCAWDFGGAFTRSDQWADVHSRWWNEPFFQIPQKAFVNEYKRLYTEVVTMVMTQMVDSLQQLQSSNWATQMDSAVVLDSQRWWPEYPSMKQQLQNAIEFLQARATWIDAKMQEEFDIQNSTQLLVPMDRAADVSQKYLYNNQMVIFINDNKYNILGIQLKD